MVKRHHLAFQPKAPEPEKASITQPPLQNSKQPSKPPSTSESNNSTPQPSTGVDSSKDTKANPPSAPPKSADNSSTKSSPPPHDPSEKPSPSTPISKPAAPSESKTSSQPSKTAAAGPPPPTSHPSSPSNSPLTKSSSPNSSQGSDKIFGIEIATIIQVSIIIGVIAIIIIILVILYRRYRTRVDYNESPQNFAHKPQLTFGQEYQLNHTKVKPLFNQNRLVIQRQVPVEGLIFQTQFKSSEKSAVYYKRLLKTVSYFEVEILNANGAVEIGFLPKSSFEKFKSGNQILSSTGVSITNSGFVQAEGENIYNYSWNLAYGDVFGIGLTRQTSKFSQRRAWVSKNGILLNSPPSDELDKWLATIQISAQQKNEYNLGTDKKGKGQQEEENEEDLKEQAKKAKLDDLLKKQRISLKTFNDFEYFAVVICHGNEDDTKCTVVNINVGGQVFRMFDSNFRAGLLKDKSFFGDD